MSGKDKKTPATGRESVFPETRRAVLECAAAGDLRPFLDEYLRPCWQEVLAACRRYGIQVHDAEDLFQELILRVMRPGSPRGASRPRKDGFATGDVAANLPGRFLAAKELGLDTARFRTFLKHTIANLLRERWRALRRAPRTVAEEGWLESLADETVSRTLRVSNSDPLSTAAVRCAERSAVARTKGRQREFAALHAVTALQMSPMSLAEAWNLDRTTVVEVLRSARRSYRVELERILGSDARSEVERILRSRPDSLVHALEVAARKVAPPFLVRGC